MMVSCKVGTKSVNENAEFLFRFAFAERRALAATTVRHFMHRRLGLDLVPGKGGWE